MSTCKLAAAVFFLVFILVCSYGVTRPSCLLSRSYQVDQLRSELMQERSARHDLEMDKSALERQVTRASSLEVRWAVLHSHSPTLVSDEGAEVSHSRHGESDTPPCWNHAAGKQDPGAGGETSQRGKVGLCSDKESKRRVFTVGTCLNGMKCFEMIQNQNFSLTHENERAGV